MLLHQLWHQWHCKKLQLTHVLHHAAALLGLLGWWLLRRRQRQLAALAASKRVSAAAWTVKFEDLEFQKELSKGAFGEVRATLSLVLLSAQGMPLSARWLSDLLSLFQLSVF